MDDADDPDPDPDGWAVHPAAAFYGLWPRFVAEDTDNPAEVAAAE